MATHDLGGFGDRLRWYAKRYYRTLLAFGEAVGRSSSEMTRAVQGMIPSGKELAMWQERTGIGISWLLTGTGAVRIEPGHNKPSTGKSGTDTSDVVPSGMVREVSDVVESVDYDATDAEVTDLTDPDELARFLAQLDETRDALLSGVRAIDALRKR